MRAAVFAPVLGAVAACTFGSGLDGLTEGVDGGAEASLPVVPPAEGGPAILDGGADAADADPYAAVVLADAPASYWRFEEDAGSLTLHDSVGGHDGLVAGPVTFGGAGVAGRGGTFGPSSHVDIGQLYDFLGKVPFTLELWVKPILPNTFNEVLSKRFGPDDGFDLYIRTDTGGPPRAQFEQKIENGGRGTTAPVEPSDFVHLVVTYEPGAGPHLFVNGVRDSSAYDDDGAAVGSTQTLMIGGVCEGTYDEVAIYDHALSEVRVTAHYRALRP